MLKYSTYLVVLVLCFSPLVFAQDAEKPDSSKCPYYKARLLGETIEFINNYEEKKKNPGEVLIDGKWEKADPIEPVSLDLSMSILIELKKDWVENCSNDLFNEFLKEHN